MSESPFKKVYEKCVTYPEGCHLCSEGQVAWCNQTIEEEKEELREEYKKHLLKKAVKAGLFTDPEGRFS
ncbi:MAG: hypothetical protein PHH61_06240 [Candidatus Nanoarchaeia archaeon]|nr:hypothetical protein [Candidatus Nanoarchaeia archaeon]